MPVQWSEDLPRRQDAPAAYPRVEGVRSEAKHLIILGHSLVGALVHFIREEGREKPCMGERCECVESGRGAMWKGFTAALDMPGRRVIIAEFTEAAGRDLLNTADTDSFRGLHITLRRSKKTKNARVTVEIVGRTERGLPADFDVRPHLLKLWGLTLTPFYGVPEVGPRPASRPVETLPPTGEGLQ